MSFLVIYLILGLSYFDKSIANNLIFLKHKLVPIHYDLNINVKLEPHFLFDGEVTIQLQCMKDTEYIEINKGQLSINIYDADLEEIELDGNTIAKRTPVKVTGRFDLSHFGIFHIQTEKLWTGKLYSLRIVFSGLIQNTPEGLYASKYTETSTNTTSWIGVTNLEPIYAREVFPCIDDPSMKTTFTIRIGHTTDLGAVSNMPLQKTEEMPLNQGWVIDHFMRTPPMSLSQVAFVISNLKSASSPSGNKTIIQCWSRKELLPQTRFALALSPEVLSLYEQFFGIPCPLPKVDLVAIPETIQIASESWGLIIFREDVLLVDSEKGSELSQELTVALLAKSLSRLWIGSLVTIQSWFGVWFKESFSAYVSDLIVDQVYPDWMYSHRKALRDTRAIYNEDSSPYTLPMMKVGNNTDDTSMFSVRSLLKGSALVRMLHGFLGDSAFQMGLNSFLKKNSFGIASHKELWDAFQMEGVKQQVIPSRLVLSDVMESWILQPGFPVVSVSRNYLSGLVIAKQSRFCPSCETTKTCFLVPLTYATKSRQTFGNRIPQWWLGCEPTVLNIHLESEDWIIFNNGLTGLYITNYDLVNWERIIIELLGPEHAIIPSMDKAKLLLDSFTLAFGDMLPYYVPLSICKYLTREGDLLPWKAALMKFEEIDTLLHRSSSYFYFKAFVKYLLTPVYEYMTKGRHFPHLMEGEERPSLVEAIIFWACKMDVGNCRNDVKVIFEKWMAELDPDNSNTVPKDMKVIIYTYGSQLLGQDAWDFLWHRYLNTNSLQDKRLLLKALGSTRQISSLIKLLHISITDNSAISIGNAPLVFESVIMNPLGFHPAKEFFVKNAYELREKFPQHFRRYLKDYSKSITTEIEYEEWAKFFQDSSFLLEGNKYSTSLEIGKSRARWTRNHLNEVTHYLKQFYNNIPNDLKIVSSAFK